MEGAAAVGASGAGEAGAGEAGAAEAAAEVAACTTRLEATTWAAFMTGQISNQGRT